MFLTYKIMLLLMLIVAFSIATSDVDALKIKVSFGLFVAIATLLTAIFLIEKFFVGVN